MANNNKHTGPNVPALRFPEFSGEWTVCKFYEIVKLLRGSSPRPIVKYVTNASDGVNWVKIGDMPIIGNKVLSTSEKITIVGSKKSRKVFPGDVILSNSMSFGKPYIMGIEGYIHDGWFVLREFESRINRSFLCAQLIAPCIQNQYKRMAAGGVVQNISSDIVNSIILCIPSLSEQKKIGRLIDLIDNRIETQSKIIEEQETLLKSLRDKLLNQYSSFSTQCRLGDILCIGNGKDYQHLNEGDIPVYGTGGLMCHVNESLYDGESVCIGRKGTINKPIFLKGRFWTVDTLFYTHSYKGVLPRFCYHLFCTIDWLTYNEASGVPSLSKSTIEKIPVLIPTIEMQGKIVQILDTIEEKVDTDRKTLQNYQNQKAYLLSRMLI